MHCNYLPHTACCRLSVKADLQYCQSQHCTKIYIEFSFRSVNVQYVIRTNVHHFAISCPPD